MLKRTVIHDSLNPKGKNPFKNKQPKPGQIRFQIWHSNGQYAMVSGDKCDEPILSRMGEKVHEFYAFSKEIAEDIKDKFIKTRKNITNYRKGV